MLEKVYLGDWLYNAGIVGFLKIFDFNDSSNDIERGDNYISFDREVLRDFPEKYFSFCYSKVNRIENKVSSIKNLLSSEGKTKKDIKISSKKNINSDTMKEDQEIDFLLSELENPTNYREIWNSYKDLYVKYYLQSFYEDKSIFNPRIKSGFKEIFRRDFIEPLFKENDRELNNSHYCKFCNERIAKKEAFFDQGAFKFTGISKNEFKNFYWNLIPNTHLCAICELIYLCSFAGLSNIKSKGDDKVYLFVNLDTTIDELYKINNTIENFTLRSEENPYRSIVHNMLLNYVKVKSFWSLQNILFVEFYSSRKEPYKINYFHIPHYVANLFYGNSINYFKSLEGIYYKKEDTKENINVISKTIDLIIENKTLFPFINTTIKELTKDPTISQNQYRISQLINIVILSQLLNIYKARRNEMEEEVTKKIWRLYYEGQSVSKALKEKGAENKIGSITYKMLSSLRIRDLKSFYDTLIRLYMNLDAEIPAIFLETFSPKSALDPEALGYAFLTGLLGKKSSEISEEGGAKNE